MALFSNRTDLDKKNVKVLRSYARYFNLKQPYKVIVGPYFCQAVTEKRISLKEGISAVFLQRDCQLYTTRCCINDLQKLIDKKQNKFIRGAHVLRTLKLLPCLHKQPKRSKGKRWKCVSSIQCLYAHLSNGNNKYCFAMQPRSYLERMRSKAGIPTIWMHEGTMILDKLSNQSQTFVAENKHLNKVEIEQKLETNHFVNDDDVDLENNYDIAKELELNDGQSGSDDDTPDTDQNNAMAFNKKKSDKVRVRKYKIEKKSKQSTKRNGYSQRNRIRYGPDGGFDTMGVKMFAKKKKRSKRKRKTAAIEPGNDNHLKNEKSMEDNGEMSITVPQKNMSDWWKTQNKLKMKKSERMERIKKQVAIDARDDDAIPVSQKAMTTMAEEQYAVYTKQYGYPPSQPYHLISFAKKNGAHVTYTEARKLITSAKANAKLNAAVVKEFSAVSQTKKQIPNELTKDESEPVSAADEQCELYASKYGHPPNKPSDLIQFARENGVECTWTQCKKAINAYSARHKIEPQQTNKRISSVLSLGVGQKIEAAKRYSNPSSPKSPEIIHPNWRSSQTLDMNTLQTGLGDLNDVSLKNIQETEEEPVDVIVDIKNAEIAEKDDQWNESDKSFEVLLSGHGSIKHRLRAMDYLCNHLEDIDIGADNGKILVHAFADQILHVDHIFNQNEVRNKAIDQIADVVIFCLDSLSRTKMLQNEIVDFVDDSMPEVLDNLFKILDDEKCQDVHSDTKQVIIHLVKAIDAKRCKLATIHLCDLLVEKVNISNISQATARFFAARQIFKRIIFRNRSKQINKWFGIDLKKTDNHKTMKKHKDAKEMDLKDLPNNRDWFDIMIAEDCDNDEDEAFKDLIIECLSVMILDENNDIAVTASNMIVFVNEFNDGYNQCLEPEAMHRFINYLCT